MSPAPQHRGRPLLAPLAVITGSLCACGPSTTDATPIVVPAADPAASQAVEPARWPHAWQWAAAVRVEPAQADVRELSGLDATVPLPLDLTIMRDAFRDSPVSVWLAPPGAQLTVPGGAPGVTGQPFTFTLSDDISGPTWVVVSDLGMHPQQWEDKYVVHELSIATGLEPWRVMLSVGGDALLDEVKRDKSLRGRLREHGVVVASAKGAGSVPVPWADLPLAHVDVPALDSMAGPTFFLATPDSLPRAVTTARPVVLLEAAGSYFGLDLVPQKAGKARDVEGQVDRPARSKVGKAGRRPGGRRTRAGGEGG